jgi:hypothetical protein
MRIFDKTRAVLFSIASVLRVQRRAYVTRSKERTVVILSTQARKTNARRKNASYTQLHLKTNLNQQDFCWAAAAHNASDRYKRT